MLRFKPLFKSWQTSQALNASRLHSWFIDNFLSQKHMWGLKYYNPVATTCRKSAERWGKKTREEKNVEIILYEKDLFLFLFTPASIFMFHAEWKLLEFKQEKIMSFTHDDRRVGGGRGARLRLPFTHDKSDADGILNLFHTRNIVELCDMLI